MLKVDEEALVTMDADYPGIVETIRDFEDAQLPACPVCSSNDTASVQCGIVGRSLKLTSATTKVLLIANGEPGRLFCRACCEFFD